MEHLHQIVKKNYCAGRLSFKTQLKIEYLLPYTGSRKVLENIPVIEYNIYIDERLTSWQK